MQDLRVTLAQTDIIWENAPENRAWISQYLPETPTDLIILPEMFTTGFSMNSKKLAENTLGETLDWMRSLSVEKQALVIGSIIVNEQDQFYNRMLIVSPEGDFWHYDKRHLFRMAKEHKYFSAGTEAIIIEWKDWKIRPLVCYDLRFPVWSRNKIETPEEYHLLVYVANWPQKRIHHWQRLLQARAIENLCYVAGVNRVGTDGNEIAYCGKSILVDFQGDIILDLENRAQFQTQTLSADALRLYRRAFPAYLDADYFTLQ